MRPRFRPGLTVQGRGTAWRAVWALIILSVLAAGAVHHRSFLADDTLISLRYAERFLAGDGLTWNDGERVEGYSNLLWILLCTVPGVFGADLIAVSRILGVLGMAAAAMALFAEMLRRRVVAAGLPWTAATLFFVLAGPTAVWSVAGMETGLVTGLLGWALVAAFRLADPVADAGGRPPLGWAAAGSTLLGLLCLTRPDGPVLAAALIAGLLAACWRRSGRFALAAQLALGPVLAVTGQLIFRLVYYGHWLPNTAHVKLGWSVQRVAEGLVYVAEGWAWLMPLTLLGVAALVPAFRSTRTRPRVLVVLFPAVVWSVYLAIIGGDVFPAFRHFPPLVLAAAAMIGLGLEALALREPNPTRPGVQSVFLLTWLAVMLLALPFGWRQLHGWHAREVATNRFVWYGEGIARTLRAAFADRDPLFAVTAAGCLPYWSKFRSLDLLGLCDEHIARNRPEDFGKGPLAHELGDPVYLLERAPDLMFFGPPAPGAGRQLGGRYGHDLLVEPRFQREYHSVRLRVDAAEPFHCYAWLRATSPKLGWRVRGTRLEIPAYFFNGNPESEARLSAAGALVLPVSPRVPGYLRLGRLDHEILAIETSPAATAARAGLRASTFLDESGMLCIGLESEKPVQVETVTLVLSL